MEAGLVFVNGHATTMGARHIYTHKSAAGGLGRFSRAGDGCRWIPVRGERFRERQSFSVRLPEKTGRA